MTNDGGNLSNGNLQVIKLEQLDKHGNGYQTLGGAQKVNGIGNLNMTINQSISLV